MVLDRRDFLKGAALVAALANPQIIIGYPRVIKGGLEKLASLEYRNISHSPINWQEIQEGLYFARIDVLRGRELVDRVAVVKFVPQYNRLRVFTNFESRNPKYYNTVEQWQNETGASVIFNSAQYQENPNYGAPIALLLTDGKRKGPNLNRHVRGMLVAEPTDKSLPLVDLLDFDYDAFDPDTTQYTQGVQHYPILLDRKSIIKVAKSNWQANRTVVAKDKEKNILVFVTEGGFFTLHNFGIFLKESPFNIETAMNMDGGYEASMCVATPKLHYVTYGQFETYGPGRDVSVIGAKIGLPTAIGIFPRK